MVAFTYLYNQEHIRSQLECSLQLDKTLVLSSLVSSSLERVINSAAKAYTLMLLS